MPENVAAPAAPAEAPSKIDQMLAAVAEYEKGDAPNVDGNPVPAVVAAPAAGSPAGSPPAPAAPPPAAEPAKPPPEPEIPVLERIARREKALREERQQVAPYIDALKVLPPDRVQALTKALASRDPVSALASLGFSHAEYTNRLLDGATPGTPPAKADPKAPPAPVAAIDPELKAEIEELRQFKQQYQAEKAQQAQKEVLTRVADVVKANPKFKYLAGLEDYQQVIDTVQKYYTETGKLPGDSFPESVVMAAEVVEARLAKMAEKFGKLLTPAPPPATVPAQKAPESHLPSAGSEVPRTLNNGLASTPAPVRPAPQTHEERIAALLSDPTFLAME